MTDGTGTHGAAPRRSPRRTRPVLATLLAAGLAASLAGCTAGPPAADAPAGTHDVGLQAFQWTWDALADECRTSIGPTGYAWVLTSPPQEHVLGPQWWTAYQPVSYRVESRLGTRDEFAAMVDACHDAGVRVVADAVLNHMSGQEEPGEGWAGSPYAHYDYPGTWSDAAGDFHHCGATLGDDIDDYRDPFQVQSCELVNLADLATEKDQVRTRLHAYLEDLVSLGVDGFRIDAAKHMPADDVAAVLAGLPDDLLIVQEVIRGAGEPVTPEQYVGNGLVDEFGWGKDVQGLVQGGALGLYLDMGESWGYLPSDDAVIFVDNHDTERNGSTLSYADGADYLLGNVLLLASPYGTPEVHSGYAFDDRDTGPAQDADGRVVDAACPDVVGPEVSGPDATPEPGTWVCQHRWTGVVGMVGWRSAVGDAPVVDVWKGRRAIAFGRGERGFAVVNAGRDMVEETFETSLAAGTYCDVVTGALVDGACTGGTVEVADDGTAHLRLGPDSAAAWHVGARLAD